MAHNNTEEAGEPRKHHFFLSISPLFFYYLIPSLISSHTHTKWENLKGQFFSPQQSNSPRSAQHFHLPDVDSRLWLWSAFTARWHHLFKNISTQIFQPQWNWSDNSPDKAQTGNQGHITGVWQNNEPTDWPLFASGLVDCSSRVAGQADA